MPWYTHACSCAVKQLPLYVPYFSHSCPGAVKQLPLYVPCFSHACLSSVKQLPWYVPCFSHACSSAVKQLPRYVPLCFTRLFECCETTSLICALVFHTPVGVLWNNSPDMCPCVSHACPSAVKQLPWHVPLCFTRLFECCEANPGSGRSCSERALTLTQSSLLARGEWHQTTRARALFSGSSTETSLY